MLRFFFSLEFSCRFFFLLFDFPIFRSEIIFKSKDEAYEFRDNYINMSTYTKLRGAKNGRPRWWCRRNNIETGYHKCENTFQIKETFTRIMNQEFRNSIKSIPAEQRPHSIVGIFYHSHENDPKYHRTEGGGWSRNKGDLFLVCLSK